MIHKLGHSNDERIAKKSGIRHYIIFAIIAAIITLLAGKYYFAWKNITLLILSFFAAIVIGHMVIMKRQKH